MLLCDNDHIFSSTPNNFVYKGGRCSKCSNLCPIQARERFETEVVNRGFKLLGTYINTATNVEMMCDKGHIINPKPNSFISKGSGCIKCAGICPIQAEDNFILKIAENKHILLGRYINTQTKVNIQCNNGHIFSISPSNYMSGVRCNVCTELYGEQLIRNVLNYLGIPFSKNHSFEFLPTRKYDFVFRIDTVGVIVIEWDGKQHFNIRDLFDNNQKEFEDRQEVDILKTQAIIDHRYKIIRIDHTWIRKSIPELALFLHKSMRIKDLLIVSDSEMYQWLTS